jgi:hypothetical protein
MTITRWINLRSEDLVAAFTGLGAYEMPLDGCIRALYTRQSQGEWKYCLGQCVLGRSEGEDRTEVYRDFAFVSKAVQQVTIKALLESLSGSGIETDRILPPIRVAASHPNCSSEIVPSHETRSGASRRRFAASIESNSFFSEAQLMDYALPYHPSAARYAKEFLRLKATDSVDGRKGEFSIEVPDWRGAIRFAEGLISISNPAVPLRLVGTINGDIQIDVRNDTTADYYETYVRDVELWLLTKDSDVVDYISSTNWPYKYETPPQEAEQEQQLLEFIRKGESEICEFKRYIDLNNTKATEIEKTVCAFSNQRGGTLFVGITDEGDVVGLARELAKNPEDLDTAVADYEKDIRNRLRETLKDNQCFASRVATILGTRVIIVDVQPSQEVNFFVKSDLAQTAYIRHGGSSMKLSPPEMKAKIERHSVSSSSTSHVLAAQIFGPRP